MTKVDKGGNVAEPKVMPLWSAAVHPRYAGMELAVLVGVLQAELAFCSPDDVARLTWWFAGAGSADRRVGALVDVDLRAQRRPKRRR